MIVRKTKFTEEIEGEEWRDIKGLEGLYQISNLGRVRNVGEYSANYFASGRAKEPRKNHIMKTGKNSNGYYRVYLSKNRNCRAYMIHRLVADAFVENPENKRFASHKDFNKDNNNVENIIWLTNSEIQNRRYQHRYKGTVWEKF